MARRQSAGIREQSAWRADEPRTVRSKNSTWLGWSLVGIDRERLQALVLGHQFIACLAPNRIERNAIHRTYDLALRHIEVADAFGTAPRVDLVDFQAH